MEQGRPRKNIDWKQAEEMAQIMCTAEEICAVLGVSSDTMLRRCKEEFNCTFAEWLAQKQAGGKKSLRRAQWEQATGKKPNPAMQIWLGKQYLGQSDKIETKEEKAIAIMDPEKIFKNEKARNAIEGLCDELIEESASGGSEE